jgi:hypothetical protein
MENGPFGNDEKIDYRELLALATFDGVALAEEIRDAFRLLLLSRPHDTDYHDRIRDLLESTKQRLAGLELEGADAVAEALGYPIADIQGYLDEQT